MNTTKSRSEELLDLESVMQTQHGRRVLYKLLEVAGLFDETFNVDSRVHARLCGMRTVGIWLQSELETANAELYQRMVKECRYDRSSSSD